MTQDKFTQSEIKGRELTAKLLKANGITDFSFTEGKYDIYDCEFFDKNGTMWVAEIKCRDKRYKDYNDMLIEKGKLDSINELVRPFKPESLQACYINVYEDTNEAKIASIRDLKLNFKEEMHVKTSVADRNKVSKAIGYIKNFKRVSF